MIIAFLSVEADAVDVAAIPAVTAPAVFRKVRLEDMCFLRWIMRILVLATSHVLLLGRGNVVDVYDTKFARG